jgi:hypothetical protein
MMKNAVGKLKKRTDAASNEVLGMADDAKSDLSQERGFSLHAGSQRKRRNLCATCLGAAL